MSHGVLFWRRHSTCDTAGFLFFLLGDCLILAIILVTLVGFMMFSVLVLAMAERCQ